MHSGKMWMALLAAGSLAFGAAVALAATSESTEYSQKPEASKATEAPAATPSNQMKATSAEKKTATVRFVRGVVTAVEPSATPSTMTLTVMRGKQEETVGVDVPAGTKILAGKTAKTLADIKVGDRVWMKYDRMNDKLVADSIRILKKPAKTAAQKASTEKTTATPAASKTEGYK
jgi:Cu/Ag efflux protein CusF